MTKLIAQDGSQRGEKITYGLEKGNLQGAIFSPKDYKIQSIKKYVGNSKYLNQENTFLDPQFYYYTFNNGIIKNIKSYPDFNFNITSNDFKPYSYKIDNFLEKHSENTKGISETLITPGFYMKDLDWHFYNSIDLYNDCVKKYISKFNTFALSLIISVSFFSDKQKVDKLIEDLTNNVHKKKYVYLIICYEPKKNKEVDPLCLSNILYAIYKLQKNGFKFILGYCFLNSIIFSVLNCDFVASGWFKKLRRFTESMFDPKNLPYARKTRNYTSIPLLSCMPENHLRDMVKPNGLTYEMILSGTKKDKEFKNKSPLSELDFYQQYWESITLILKEMESTGDFKRRIQVMKNKIFYAQSLYKNALNSLKLSQEKIAEKNTRVESKHLQSWLDALDIFELEIKK